MMTLNLKSLISRLTDTNKTALEGAAGFCISRSHYNVEIEHWLLKLLDQESSDLLTVLNQFDVSISQLQTQLREELDRLRTGSSRAPALAPTIVDAAKKAWLLASVEFQYPQATSAHLLAALLLDDSLKRSISHLTALHDIAGESLRNTMSETISQSSELSINMQSVNTQARQNHSKTPALDQYTTNLTEQARQGQIDNVVGRDQEVRQIIDILIRRRQNNPILTGEAGVGKTAVVEGFALRIAQQDVPEPLKKVNLHSLDLGLLQAGASVKGEFENRLKAVISEVNNAIQPIILFIDEAHTLIGAGGKEGQGDAANLLKPALARGQLRTIAATTWSEYKQYFERDPALTRRFQVVKIDEPDESSAIQMMQAIAPMLQSHHQVPILDEAIVSSVKLSQRYITGRQLPDKSVSLLDTACSKVALSQNAKPGVIEDTERYIQQIKQTRSALQREHDQFNHAADKLDTLNQQQDAALLKLQQQQQQWQQEKELITKLHTIQDQITAITTRENDFEPASRPSALTADATELAELQSQAAEWRRQLKVVQGEQPMMFSHVTGEAIAEVVANWTGIPVGKMQNDELDTVRFLDTHLNQRVIGQQHAMQAIAKAIKTSRAGLTDVRKPIGVFFMVGSSGVGKTETAVALADILFGGQQSLTTINMSEFKEEHKISMLLGSPPGYIGYGEGGVLTEAVRRKPYSVILLDEMEKAHPGVQDVFYNLFDKGTIKDGEGRDIDFRNTLIIMTSNAAEEHIRAICAATSERPDPDVLLDNFRPQLLHYFKPAFLGRATLIPYYPLSDTHLIEITKISLRRLEKRIQDHYQAGFSYDEEVLVHIVARSQEVDTGARNIESILSQTLLPGLAEACLNRLVEEEPIQHVHASVDDTGFSFSFQSMDQS